MMNVTSTVLGDTLIAKLDGRVDANSCKGLEEQAMGWIENGRTRLVFDCETMEYVSSAGLRVFLLIAKRVGEKRGSVKLCAMSPGVREIFDISGFSQLFTIVPAVSDAL